MKEQTPVNLYIHSKIRNEGDTEIIEFRSSGSFYIKDSVPYLSYKEEQEYGTIQTIVKMKPGETLVFRSGAVSMKQRFIKDTETLTHYKTPLGTLQMTTYTSRMTQDIHPESAEGKLEIEYELHMGEGQSHLHSLLIDFKEATS
ncbi:DUF1934 domain-containing protein [Bacillus sp. FJAT-42376]|uniref:DUF1934 domain-containing protein n=1 Tax=Bacillus sp. FJAT-42376 TaxID=2014076 RepID=UPI000F4FC6E0|nr:DUF1934 family protein [Bacillus sp. FJAT-42376]AZB40946.1 DUF1934 domain-containing protein [Bacillus sp. FJAT-42376]